jgi:inner membrane protein
VASAFGHAFLAYASGNVLEKKFRSAKFWLLGIMCSVLPDFDVIAFNFGIPYEHMFGHRGITHSIVFGFLLAFVVLKGFYRKEKFKGNEWWILFAYFSFCTISHGMLDAMTMGGRGVAFFAPFSDERYFFPWRMIKVSPMSISRFFSPRAWKILANEAIWIGIPCVVLLFSTFLVRKFNKLKA